MKTFHIQTSPSWSAIKILSGIFQSLHQKSNIIIKMWGELDEADDRSFNLKVYGTNNEYTGISVNVVPSMMTIMDLKRQFAEKVTLISIYPSIQHCHCLSSYHKHWLFQTGRSPHVIDFILYTWTLPTMLKDDDNLDDLCVSPSDVLKVIFRT